MLGNVRRHGGSRRRQRPLMYARPDRLSTACADHPIPDGGDVPRATADATRPRIEVRSRCNHPRGAGGSPIRGPVWESAMRVDVVRVLEGADAIWGSRRPGGNVFDEGDRVGDRSFAGPDALRESVPGWPVFVSASRTGPQGGVGVCACEWEWLSGERDRWRNVHLQFAARWASARTRGRPPTHRQMIGRVSTAIHVYAASTNAMMIVAMRSSRFSKRWATATRKSTEANSTVSRI